MTSRVKVHTKVLTSPDVSLTTVFQNMREVYATVNIGVEWATEETLNLPALNVVDVGQCIQGQTTSEQNQLFINRNFAGANDIVVYFVLATDPPFNGCHFRVSGSVDAPSHRFEQATFELAYRLSDATGFHVELDLPSRCVLRGWLR